MFEGVYCTEKNSNTVFESILIDSFNDSVDSALNPQSCIENLSESVEMSSVSDQNSDSKSSSSGGLEPLLNCVAGDNVRATYSADGKLYEAVVLRLFGKPPNILARVRYYGYDNEEAVAVNLIFPSLGPIAVKEQIERAKLEMGDEQISSDESVQKEINWKKGMAGRASYDNNDTIYEVTVLDVNESEKTAHVEILGYGTRFHAKFENMYETMPEERKKQAISAQKYNDEKMQQKHDMTNCGDQPSHELVAACSSFSSVENNSDFEKKDVTEEQEPKNVNERSEKTSQGSVVKWSVPLIQNQSSESEFSNGVHVKENKSNCTDLQMKVGVISDIPKKSNLKCTNEKVQSSETLALDRALLKESETNNLDFEAKVDVPSETLKERKFQSINEKVQDSEQFASVGDLLKENPPNSFHIETKEDASNEPKLYNNSSDLTDALTDNHLPLSLRNEGILQPETEAEALACLLSANYLSGYYAGYYDCIRKRLNEDKSET